MGIYEDIANAIMDFVSELAEEKRINNDGYFLFTVGEFDKLSCLCDEIANIVVGAVNR